MAKKKQDDGGGVPEWLVTFGDMMSLLLTFFIMLFSMSEIKKDDKFHAMVESLRKTFGYETTEQTPIPGTNPNQNSLMKSLANLARAKQLNLMKGGAPVNAPIGENPRVRSDQDYGKETSMVSVRFKEGSDILNEEAKKLLDKQASLIIGNPQMIEVTGHTSNRPLPEGSQFRDHWDLAFERAKVVKKYLESLGINPKRIQIGVAAGNDLHYKGTDPEKQAENARAEVRLLREKFVDSKAK
ncbi:MAG: flagellar motor protein MotB [Planctomycetia bacterium]|jgi:chemotaxis protein MotB